MTRRGAGPGEAASVRADGRGHDEGRDDREPGERDSDEEAMQEEVEEAAVQTAEEVSRQAEDETGHLVEAGLETALENPEATTPGPPLNRRNPFLIGLVGGLGLLASYGVAQLVMRLGDVLTWVVVALFIALGLEPIVSRLIAGGLSRGLAVLATLCGFLVVCGLLGWMIVPPIIDQLTLLVNNAPGYVDHVQHSRWFLELNRRWHISDRVLSDLRGSLNQKTVTSLAGGLLGAGKVFAHAVEATFTIVVLTIYFVVALPRVKTAFFSLVPRGRRPRVVFLGEEISRRVGGYILGQLCVAVVNAVFAWIILTVLGLPYPAMLATLVGLLALVPIVGTLIGGVIMTLVALSSSWVDAVIVLGYYVGYHLFETYVLSPRIMRRAVEVPPVITIIAVLAGGALFGIIGALLAIPVAAGLLLIYDQVLVPRQQRS
jgi:predicted PurR-regulated permease PerM